MIEKPIKLSVHALEQLRYRGAVQSEVVDAVLSSSWVKAELGRMECRKDFPFNKEWNGKYYSKKQVRPIFVEEPDSITIVTVYVYYF